MARILVTTSLPATPEQVWDDIRHIDRHVEWRPPSQQAGSLNEEQG